MSRKKKAQHRKRIRSNSSDFQKAPHPIKRNLIVISSFSLVGIIIIALSVALWPKIIDNQKVNGQASRSAESQNALDNSPSIAEPSPTQETSRHNSSVEETLTTDIAIESLTKEALDMVKAIVKEYPDSIEAVSLMANTLRSLGKSAEALIYWKRCLEIDPNKAEVYDGIGRISMQKGDINEAARMWRKALEINPRMSGVSISLGRALMSLGKPSAAAPILKTEVKNSPRNVWCHFLLAQAYFQLKEYEAAKRHYEAAINIDPKHTNAHYGLANACARLGLRDAAKIHMQSFAALKKQDLKGLKEETEAFNDERLTRQGLAHFYSIAGQIYLREKQYSTAEMRLLKAARLDATNVDSRKSLANLYFESKRPQQALEVYQELTEIEPTNFLHCLNVGVISARFNKPELAEKSLKKACALAPHQAAGFRELARLYLSENRKLSEARQLAQEAVKIDASAQSYFFLSWAHKLCGDSTASIVAIEQAIKLDPHNPQYLRIRQQLSPR
jgi:tetratricopeptide (TPR) repeat protein